MPVSFCTVTGRRMLTMTARYDFNDSLGADNQGNAHPRFATAFPDWQDAPIQRWGQYAEMVMRGTIDGEPVVGEDGVKRAIGNDVVLERDDEGRPLLGDLSEIDGWCAQRVEKLGRTYMNENYRKLSWIYAPATTNGFL